MIRRQRPDPMPSRFRPQRAKWVRRVLPESARVVSVSRASLSRSSESWILAWASPLTASRPASQLGKNMP